MNDAQKRQLVEALLKCRTLSEKDWRDAVVNDLPDHIKARIRRSDVPRLDVTGIVSTCLEHPDGLNSLIAIVRNHEKDSLPMREVDEVLSRPAARPGLPSSPRVYAGHDDDVWIGQELHWDREHVVDTFVNMIRQSSKYPYRVLGIQGPKAAGIPSLVKRLQEMCDKTTGLRRPLLWATITLDPTLATPYSLAREVLTQLHSKAAYNREQIIRLQATTLMKHCKAIERGEGTEALAKERPSPYELAYDLTNNLREVAQSCTVVLLLEQFDQLCDSDSGKWLMDEWLLKNASQVESGLVIVITGERGLDNLEGDGIHCFPSLSTMTVEDFKSWTDCVLAFAPMSLEEIQVLHDEMKADVEEFRRYLFWESKKRRRMQQATDTPSSE